MFYYLLADKSLNKHVISVIPVGANPEGCGSIVNET
jgi:hypothetical protein